MKRIGMTWQVAPDKWEEYKAIHLNPWPDLIQAIQAAGIHNYNIFAVGTQVFAYLEVDNDDSLIELQKAEVMSRWNEKVLPWVLPEAAEGGGVQFMELEQIFYCE